MKTIWILCRVIASCNIPFNMREGMLCQLPCRNKQTKKTKTKNKKTLKTMSGITY